MEHKKRRGLLTRAQGKFRAQNTPESLLKAAEVEALGDRLGVRVGGIDRAERINAQVRMEMEEDQRRMGMGQGQRALQQAREARAKKAMDIFNPPEEDKADNNQDPGPAPGHGPDDDPEGLQAYVDPGASQSFGLDPLISRRRRSMLNFGNLT
tara:strand:- start:509 stop:967 length:459 start_codon:yes stop_codon:yes gene_type:complete